MNKKLLATLLPLALAAAYGTHASAQEAGAQAASTQGASTADAGARLPTAQPGADASGQSTPAGTTGAGPAASQEPVSTVVVTGFRSSLQKALNLKQQAIGVRDSIVAEDIGKFPEANVAESLQRVPGVILNRDESSGEGQRISIRGLPTEYSVTTLNGAPVNTTSTSTIGSAARGFNYDVFASELFGRIDFYKSPLAELTEGGLGGIVDLQTPRPFDNPKRQVRYGITAGYNTMSERFNPAGFALYSNTWGNWGFLVGGSHSGSMNNRSGFEATGGYNSSFNGSQSPVKGNFAVALDYDSPLANLGGYTRDQVDRALLPRIYRFYGSQNDRTRDGLVSSLQYKNGGLNISFDTLYSKLKNERDEMYFGILVRNSRTTNRNAPAGQNGNNGFIPLDVSIDPSSNLLEGTFGNTSYSSGVTYANDETEFGYGALNLTYKASDKLTFTAQASANNSSALSYQSTLSGQIFGITSTIDYGDDHVYPSLSSPTSYTDPNNFQGFQIGTGWTKETDKGRQARAAAEYSYELPGGWTGKMKSGFSFVETTKGIDKRNGTALATARLNQLGTAGLRSGMTSNLPISNLDMGGGWPGAWGTFDRGYTYSTFNPLEYNPNSTFTPAQSFTAQEKVSTAFVQSDFRGEVFGRELRFNAGVRYSETKTYIDNFQQAGANNAYVPNEEEGKYSNVLPAVSAAFDVTDTLMWRASWGKTISRASLGIIAAQTVIPNQFDNTATAGNPNLKPQQSKNFDTSLEWYFKPGSLLSAGYFRKVLTDATVSTTQIVNFGSLGLPDTSLGPIFQDANGRVDPNLPMTLRTYSNAGKQVLKGYELAYQQAFDFLPDPFKGFGALASFTHIDPFNSQRWITNSGREIEVNSVPKFAYSTTGYYERGPLAVRLSWNYKGRSLHGDNPRNNGDDLIRWRAARGYLDGNISYKISDKLELRIDALNLSNTLAYDYFEDANGVYGSGKKTRMDYAKYDGRTIKIGIRGSL
ncbi:TonB-dependent receptor [Pseudoduganella albidiflava]|uniref:TonB-dependent receptor n=1 Tax=Pseudoduganella albidiflava TaxID=321983 RepID=A0A411WW88_9BURK|nr:TonB-dependent receptor [Pseudoduganella albidiflava]QBI00909.1 TonB-dependent receptor [Pseudoduganella albidiflava]GGY60554.1 TonB-dependent receptor [Pseudoduganella albidiflava]